MEAIYLLGIGVVLYVVSDRILRVIERWRGGVIPERSLIFFGILLGLALATFAVIRQVTGS
jgi:hypothetical protein